MDLDYDANYIRGLLAMSGTEWPRIVVFNLPHGTTAWNPASTKTGIYAQYAETTDLIYSEHQDGGIDVDVLRY